MLVAGYSFRQWKNARKSMNEPILMIPVGCAKMFELLRDFGPNPDVQRCRRPRNIYPSQITVS